MSESLQGTVLDKVLMLLEMLGRDGTPVRLTTLSRRTGLPKSTVCRLLAVMVAHGIVAREEAAYVLGERLFDLAAAGDPRFVRSVRRLALPHLIDLHAVIGGMIGIATPWNDGLLYLDTVHGYAQTVISSRVLCREDSHYAICKMLLSGKGNLLRFAFTDRWAPHVLMSVTALDRPLADARQEARTRAAVAAPVFGRGEQMIAALGTEHRRDTFNEKAVTDEVRRVASALSVTFRRAGIHTASHLLDMYY
jgi:DNA-binding IclR family transcriptional regulator